MTQVHAHTLTKCPVYDHYGEQGDPEAQHESSTPAEEPPPEKKKKKRFCCCVFCWCFLLFLIIAGIAVAVILLVVRPFDNGACPSQQPSCDDGNLCTIDTAVCNAGTWECKNTPMQCSNPNTSCDLADGVCKNDDDLVPCVAVIDEDDDFAGDRDEMWAEFRRLYPRRPFCLLIPEPGPLTGDDIVTLPVNFESDPLVVIQRDIPRDNGDETMASDWVAKCGLDRYTSANVPWVGLFIDNSSSMYEYQVAASRDLFINKLNAKNIQYKKVVNEEENWIEPFMTTLVPE